MKTIQFLLDNQARFDARMEANFARAEERFAKSEARFARSEKRMDRVERVVAQMAAVGLKFRNEMRRAEIRNDRETKELRERHAELAERHAETDDKLNALIDLVDKNIRRNGRKRSNGR